MNSMIKRIDHVELATGDLNRAIEFYTTIIGFTLHSRERISVDFELAYLKLGDTMLELMQANRPTLQPTDEWRLGVKLFALEVDNMDKEISRLKSKGVEVSRPPISLGPSKRAEIKDPDGVSIELRQW